MKNLFYLLFLLLHTTPLFAQTWQQLDSLGQALTKQQKLKEADSVLQIALKKVEAQHGKDTSYAKVASSLAVVYSITQQYSEAEQLCLEAKEIRERMLGKNSQAYAASCNNLAILYFERNFYDKAESLYLEAKSVRERVLGKKHVEYAQSCNNLAALYREQAFYDKAEVLYLEAKNAFENIFGKKHPAYAGTCTNLAFLYSEQGFYDRAESLYLEAKSIQKELLGNKHLQYAASCHNLGILYYEQGLYYKADALYLEAKDIREEVLGQKSQSYAMSCIALANSYNIQGNYTKAELLCIQARDIMAETMGKTSIDYANSCNNLGALYVDYGHSAKAEPLYSEAKDIYQAVLGDQHPYYALSCGNLSILYSNYGIYDKAEILALTAKSIEEKIFGVNHRTYANNYFFLANLYRKQGVYEKAYSCYLAMIQSKCDQIKNLFPILSEQEKTAYWQSIRYLFDRYSDFSQDAAHQNPVIMADLYDQTLFTKGIIFSSTQKIKNTILNSGDTVLVNQYNDWKKQRETYTKLYQLPLEEQKMQNLDLDDMKNQINDLEKDLSKKSALFGQNVQTKSYKWQEVKAKLAKNEAVIEIIKSDSAYIALFLTAQTEDYPAFHLFKNVLDLETNYLSFYKNCIEFKIEDTVSYNAFWKPIADKLSTLNKKGFKKIYFSPDGVFHQLSLNTLKNPKTNQFLLEEANIQLIGSSRDLIELNKKSRDLSQNYENYQAHLLGYPIYGTENGEPIKNRDRAAGFSGVQSAVGVAGAVSLLPGTKKEVENVFGLFNQKKLKVNLLLAENATEEALKNLKSPTILHVATHGFFIPEIKDSEVQDMQTAMNRNLLKNPFLRSGLLLAGCQKPNPEGEDGILTAEEVMNLTLDNTELVVMSACETGLGDIQAGEGVFGLQRAFQQAGAKSVLMSLWKVDDDATQTLMTEFYTALLKGQSKRQAFKTAQMNLKKRFPEPYYWGAFVMVGE